MSLDPLKPPSSRSTGLHCNEFFRPDSRRAQRQRWCLKPDCRTARQRQNPRGWLATPENQNYFRAAKNAERVRDWQQEHPGCWQNTARDRRRALPDDSAASTRRLASKGHAIPGRVPGINSEH